MSHDIENQASPSQFEEVDPEDLDQFDEPEEDELSPEFVEKLIDRMMQFGVMLVGHDLHEYQKPFARRVFESVIINDGEELTALASRQSGKTEIISFVVATLMVLMPRLAKIYPDLLGKFKDGIWIGMFAPVESQVETLFGRTVNRLTSENATEILSDPEIDDVAKRTGGVTKGIVLKKSGSTLTMMTANPKANIESKSFHLIIIDEAQATDDFVVSKSIAPMAAYYNGTIVKTGTPTVVKNHYYRAIQLNKRRATQRGRKQNHFQWDWKTVAKYNPNYEKFIRKEMLRIGEDSDEFRLSYCVSPETRILTEDLRHVKADEVQIGDLLIGFDEHRPGKGQHRKLKTTVVEDVRDLWLPCYRLTLSDGTTVTCSSDHRWLVSTAGRRTLWKTTEELTSTDRIFKITDVWESDEDYRTGYLAGIFDGEGSLNLSNGHAVVTYAQRSNAAFRKTQRFLNELGFKADIASATNGTNRDVNVVSVGGGRAETMRFLGQVRPQRLLDNLDVDKLGSIGRHDRKRGGFDHPSVVSKEFVGEQRVVSITTSSSTFVAEGLASHNCGEWLLEQGMFVSEAQIEGLGDKGQQVVKTWHRTPVVVGIDPARKTDSTIVTVVWVDWDRPDEFGYYDHRILNWLDLSGMNWEEQYFEITNFLANYDVYAVAVDANGVGDAVAQRLKVLMPRAEVVPVTSSPTEQSARYKHLQALIQRKMIGWPAHAFTRRLRTYKRFVQQMSEAELVWKGPNMLVAAPDEAHAHDDYVDSLSLACSLTKDQVMPQVEVASNVFFSR